MKYASLRPILISNQGEAENRSHGCMYLQGNIDEKIYVESSIISKSKNIEEEKRKVWRLEKPYTD